MATTTIANQKAKLARRRVFEIRYYGSVRRWFLTVVTWSTFILIWIPSSIDGTQPTTNIAASHTPPYTTTIDLQQRKQAPSSIMKYTAFHEQQFRNSVQKALKTVQTILEAERHPVLAADEPHLYQDKFALAEFLSNTAVAALMNALTVLGLQPDMLQTLSDWVLKKKQSVTLRFLAEDACTFLKEQDVEVHRPAGEHEVITTTETTKKGGGLFGSHSNVKEETTTTATRVVVRVKEFHWKVGVRYKLIAFPGTAVDEAITLQQRTSETVLITQQSAHPASGGGGKIKAPLPERTSHPPVDASLTWFVRMISPDDQTCQFAIDRNHKACKTPRRNDNVQQAVDFYQQLGQWARITHGFFLQRMEREILGKDNPVHKRPAPPSNNNNNIVILEPGATGTMQGLTKEPSFNGKKVRILEYNREQQRYKAEPVDAKNSGLPPTLSIKPANIRPDRPPPNSSPVTFGPPLSTVTDDGIFNPILPLMENGAVLPLQDAGDFLQEQMRSLDEALDNLARDYPSKQLVKLVSVAEASLVLVCKHAASLAGQYQDSVDYVEDMLKQQLVQAVGKEIDHSDFEQFMRFYHAKFFGPEFAPTAFSHAIRRPGHYPDGILSIESTDKNDPIETWVRSVSGQDNPSVFIPINAACSIEITGDRFLHGWMQHRFKSKTPNNAKYQLACRARQFSSFLVVLGTIAGPDKFEPKHAIILQNKDELTIPLMTAVLPSAKEFKDSIKSLSPEQQEFAKAYRGMQLESSVFGICVIQLKPQLEKLLGLPGGALTKEIKLTQDLMSLFVDYQIPSDLLTFDGAPETSPAEKVGAVKGYVKSVFEVIDESKKNQLKEEELKADMRHEMEYHPSAGGAGSSSDRGEMMGTERGGGGRGLRRRLMKKSGAVDVEASLPAFKEQVSSAPRATSAVSQAKITMQSNIGAMLQNTGQAECLAERSDQLNEQASVFKKRSTDLQTAPMSAAPAPLQPPYKPEPQDFSPPSEGPPSEKAEDFTLIPRELDAKLEKHDKDGSLRSTIITAGTHWSRIRQENFLTGAKQSRLSPDTTLTEKKKAFDLLDAISRSGTLAIECSELHVVVAVSHCFDNDLIGTIIQDNVNPISKLEQSSLMLASTVYGQQAANMIRNEQDAQRLRPLLLEDSPTESGNEQSDS